MSITLFNPTNEDFSMMFGGRGYVVPAGGKLKVEDACGKHLLNSHAPRGLCALEFGDDENVVATQGRDRNLEFKKHQVMNHNQSNIARRQQGLPFRMPNDVIKAYAKELHITLEEPYTPQSKGDDRVAALEAMVADLTKTIGILISKTTADEEPSKVVPLKKEK